jgi:hypothetical protein
MKGIQMGPEEVMGAGFPYLRNPAISDSHPGRGM